MRFPWSKERELTPLEQLVASVEGQREVYDADYATALSDPDRRVPMEEIAIDGVAHHVFNTLRGADDSIADGTFADIRKIVAEAFGA